MKKYRFGFVINTDLILMKNIGLVLKKYIYDLNEIYRFGFVLKKNTNLILMKNTDLVLEVEKSETFMTNLFLQI